MDVLDTGALMYKEPNPKKDRIYTVATLLKRMRNEHSGEEAVKGM